MYNICPEGTENKYVTSPNVGYLVRNVHVRSYKRIRNSPHRYNPKFVAAREWKNDAVTSIVYMIQDRDINRNLDTDNILSLLAEWDTEQCMYTPRKFHMRESYSLMSQNHDPDIPTYMEAF